MAACPTCGTDVPHGSRFCPSCGGPLAVPCPACGAETGADARYCPSCGRRLGPGPAGEEERKLVTVLFADLTGSTALGEQLDPERLRALLGDYFRAMTGVVEARGGTVEKFIGDAVMAVFGLPQVREDDAERALQAALDMQARLAEMNPELEERHGIRLAIRIGVNTGEVIAEPGRDQFMVTGDVVNVAARLQASAEPGWIAVGERTHLAARDAFRFDPLLPQVLKGKSGTVAAWRLVAWAGTGPSRPPGLAGRLVGRERELALMETLYRATVDERRPRLVTVRGDAGVGKTRLIEEFLTRARSGEEVVAEHRGRCLPYGEGITYWALREILWAAAGILLGDPGGGAGEKLRTLVSVAFGEQADLAEVERVTFALATTAGISLPGNPYEDMSPESVGEELGLAWPRFLSALAADGPLVVVIEDLHRAEPPLLDMVERLVARTTGPVLILATARPELTQTRPGWSGRPGMTQISLEPLTEEQGRELLEDVLPDAGVDLRERILQAAEGNPLFAEEIVRHLIDRGVLRREEGRLVETGTEADVALPDSVRALLAARIDALPPEEKRTLQHAAVVGRSFWAPPLEAMRPGAPIREALLGLEDRGLLVTRPTSSLPGQTELAFVHGLTREAAYASIPKGRRADAHAAVGRWIEELAGDRREEFVDLVAHHYGAAAQPEDAELAWPDDPATREDVRSRAVASLLGAGDAARARFAIDQAIGFAERALALAGRDEERLACLELKARAAHAGVRADEAWATYLEAMETARSLGDREAEARLGALATLLWSRYGGAFTTEAYKARTPEIVSRGLALHPPQGSTFEAGAFLVGRAALWFRGLGAEDAAQARRDAERAVEIAEAVGSFHLLSHALDLLSGVVSAEGYCESAEMAERLLHVARVAPDRLEAHEMLVAAASSAADAGRFDLAADAAAEAERLAASLASHHRIHAAGAQSWHLLPTGRLGELERTTASLAELIQEEGGHACGTGSMAVAARAVAAHEAGDRAETARLLGLYDAASPPRASSLWRYWSLRILAYVLERGELRTRLEEAAAPGSRDVAASVERVRALLPLLALSGEWDRVAELSAQARDLARSACAPYLAWIADWAEAARLAAEGRSREALARSTEACGALDGFGERYPAARLMADLLPLLPRRGEGPGRRGRRAAGVDGRAHQRRGGLGARPLIRLPGRALSELPEGGGVGGACPQADGVVPGPVAVGGPGVFVSKSPHQGRTWSAPVVASSSADGFSFFQGLDVAPNGRVDLAYQALKATDPSTYGGGNATIDSYYVNSTNGGVTWSTSTKVTSASSDPAASSQNNLARQFWGDYSTLVSTTSRAWFIYTDSRNGASCPAVDAYQHGIDGSGPATAKPAPGLVCPAQFGNTDIFVSKITP